MARPIGYDRKTVLDQAMHVFWHNGFCATHMRDLTSATRLKPGSLYGAFPSKEALFLEALNHYGTRSVDLIRADLSTAPSPLAGIHALVTRIATETRSAVPGCLLVNTAVELARHNVAVRRTINTYRTRIHSLLAETLTRARTFGEIPQDKDPEALATFALCIIWGLRTLGPIDPQDADITAVTRTLLDTLTK